MRVSVPGVPGVYYDTDTGSTAVATVFSAAGRKAPKPKGYALQALPYLWSFEVDLREVPNDHPIQYLHPEGARSLSGLSPDGVSRTERGVRQAGTELESVLRFVWEVNREVESATSRLIGRSPEDDGVVIEIEDGSVSVGGEELETNEFDVDVDADTEVEESDPANEVDIDVESTSTDSNGFENGDEFDPDSSESDESDDSSGYDTGDEF